MRKFDHQSGMTAISWIFVLAVGAFFVMLALRLTPIYYEHFKVITHLKSLKNHDNIAAISHRQIKQVLFKRFSIDDVKHVKDKNVLISENRDTRSISIEYEVRTPVFGNIDLIVGFSNEIEVHR